MKREKLSKTAATGAVALIFLILGFQIAVFFGNVFGPIREWRAGNTTDIVEEETGNGNIPDDNIGLTSTEGLQNNAEARSKDHTSERGNNTTGKNQSISQRIADATNAPAKHEESFTDSRTVLAEKYRKRHQQTFLFNPNTVSHDSLVLLGFSDRQAEVIENYRNKGGKFRNTKDFAKMYVVDSAMFARLEPFIDIPKIELNTADSATLISLPGIGPYYAKKILEYKTRLGGFVNKEQLLEIEGIDEEKYVKIKKLVEVGKNSRKMNIWQAEQWQLERHPYIGKYAAKGIIRYKSVTDSSAWTLKALVENNILQAKDTVFFSDK